MNPMPTATEELLEEAVTPTDLLAAARRVATLQRRAGQDQLLVAAAWADAHPLLDDDGSPYPVRRPLADVHGQELGTHVVGPEDHVAFDPDRGIPLVHPRAASSLAAALGRASGFADALMRDALVLRHRLPAVWALVVKGGLEGWRARRIAQLVLGRPDDVCVHLDTVLAPVCDRVGAQTLDRLLDEAMLRLYPEEREAAQLAALDARYATLVEDSLTHGGVAEFQVRGEWKDVHDFDATVAEVAAALAAGAEAAGEHVESLDVRRSRAVGVLADPAQALALLEPTCPHEHTSAGRQRSRKRLQLVVHLSAEALEPLGGDRHLVARTETGGGAGVPTLADRVRDWTGRADTDVTVLPVVDLADHEQVEAYEVTDRLARRVELRRLTCAHPHCDRPARHCDKDHTVPYDHADPTAGGATCDCNLVPQCRRHHNDKTLGGWRYTALDATTWLWQDPHGQQFLVDATGTRDVTPPDRPVARHQSGVDRGCRVLRRLRDQALGGNDPPAG